MNADKASANSFHDPFDMIITGEDCGGEPLHSVDGDPRNKLQDECKLHCQTILGMLCPEEHGREYVQGCIDRVKVPQTGSDCNMPTILLTVATGMTWIIKRARGWLKSVDAVAGAEQDMRESQSALKDVCDEVHGAVTNANVTLIPCKDSSQELAIESVPQVIQLQHLYDCADAIIETEKMCDGLESTATKIDAMDKDDCL